MLIEVNIKRKISSEVLKGESETIIRVFSEFSKKQRDKLEKTFRSQ